jgi:hypothetical protein
MVFDPFIKVKKRGPENAMFPAEAVDPSEGTDCFCLGVLS